MNARFIITAGIFAQDLAQVRLPQYDHFVETFPKTKKSSATIMADVT
jgi:hypothetical protein